MVPSFCSFLVLFSGLMLLQHTWKQARMLVSSQFQDYVKVPARRLSETFLVSHFKNLFCNTFQRRTAQRINEQQQDWMDTWIFFISWNGLNTNICPGQKASIFFWAVADWTFLIQSWRRTFHVILRYLVLTCITPQVSASTSCFLSISNVDLSASWLLTTFMNYVLLIGPFPPIARASFIIWKD